MAKKKGVQDIDYAVVSARIRTRERNLLNTRRMEQILEAHGEDEVERVLQECGYTLPDAADPEELNRTLADIQKRAITTLMPSIPDKRLLDLFRIKYDYHNIKCLLKSRAKGEDGTDMLIDMGRVPVSELCDAFRRNDFLLLPDTMAEGIEEASGILDAARDPLHADVVLDRYMFREIAELAEETESEAVQGYARILTDATNLRTVVRTKRMGKKNAFLEDVLLEGGEVELSALLSAVGTGAELTELFDGELAEAAEAGRRAAEGGSLTEFETLCDDAVNGWLYDGTMISFGEYVLLAYLAELEAEFVNLRVLLLGRQAGLSADAIRPRLRRTNM